jgi:hypothetical protein
MPEREHDAIHFTDDDGSGLDATWSGSGKRLIFTIDQRGTYWQVLLRPDQVARLAEFLAKERD